MKTINLTQGRITIVDDSDYCYLSQWKWFAAKTCGKFYAARAKPHKTGHFHMHRIILEAPSDLEVDHRNGNTLDNRRQNLRLCKTAQNQHNSRIHVDNTSGFKGVDKASNGKWRARIGWFGKRLFLGYFDDVNLAVIARENAARLLHGEFANPGWNSATGKVG